MSENLPFCLGDCGSCGIFSVADTNLDDAAHSFWKLVSAAGALLS